MKTLEIDVIKLYAGKIRNLEDTAAWNRWLTDCLARNDLDGLVNVRYGIQLGMAAAQRKGLVYEDLAVQFARWVGSIDKTIRKIVKQRSNNPNDTSLKKAFQTKKSLADKRTRDQELEKFLRRKSY